MCTVAFGYAIYNEHPSIAIHLLNDSRVDPSSDDNDPFIAAIYNYTSSLRNDRGTIDIESNAQWLCLIERMLENPHINPVAQNYKAIYPLCEYELFDIIIKIMKHPRTILTLPILKYIYGSCDGSDALFASNRLTDICIELIKYPVIAERIMGYSNYKQIIKYQMMKTALFKTELIQRVLKYI